jgi:peptidoglycan/xylan/chitin deacetylase (PgdA/CDA1 family)
VGKDLPNASGLLGLVARGSMTRFHYLILSKLNKAKLKIPNNKAKAVTISFDVETWPKSYGGFVDESADPAGEYFTYIPKLLNVLDDYSIRAHFFVCGKVLDLYPEVFKEVARRGHDLGGHGYCHEMMPYFSHNGQKTIISKVRLIMLQKVGYDLKSWRCPGLAANVDTYKALKDEGITFSSNAKVGSPMRIKGVVELPLTNKMDGQIIGFNEKKTQDPNKWVDYMKIQLNNLIECERGVMVFGMHMWLQRRVDPDCKALEKFLRYLNSRRDEYWIGGFGKLEERR